MASEDLSPEQIIMEANIREFGHRISMICALETGGKITSDEEPTPASRRAEATQEQPQEPAGRRVISPASRDFSGRYWCLWPTYLEYLHPV